MFQLCEKHHFGISKPAQITKVPEAGGKGFTKTWNSIKNAAESVKPKKVIFSVISQGRFTVSDLSVDLANKSICSKME